MVCPNNERNPIFENNVKLPLELNAKFIFEKSQTSTNELPNYYV